MEQKKVSSIKNEIAFYPMKEVLKESLGCMLAHLCWQLNITNSHYSLVYPALIE